MKNRKVMITAIVLVVAIVVLWSRLSDFGAEIYIAFA